MRRRRAIHLLMAATLAHFVLPVASSQAQGAQPVDRKKVAEPAQAAKARAKPNVETAQEELPVSLDQALYLIRSTLLTLNDANVTGNYAVLRDLAAPGAQERYTAADLAQIFGTLRENRVSLSSVALAAPQLSAPPRLESSGQLRLIGTFPTQPRQINFDLLFQIVGGHWKWLGISVTTPDAPASAASGK
jgi:hypothetical protein